MRLSVLLVLIALIGLGFSIADHASSQTRAAGVAQLARADALSTQWGRCPDARPAQRILDRAHRTATPRLRATRARAAVAAWTAVAHSCAQPVDQPTVTVSG